MVVEKKEERRRKKGVKMEMEVHIYSDPTSQIVGLIPECVCACVRCV